MLMCKMQEYGCAALWNLAANEDNKVTIAEAGGITTIQSAMKNHSLIAGFQDKGHDALRNLDCNTDNKVTIAKTSGIVATILGIVAMMLLCKIIHGLY